jgi:hypothetical protein
MKNDGFDKKYGGYNFAFLVDSRYAMNASDGKYGKNAILFQHAGELIYHYGDDEDQVVFWGPSVDPRGLIMLDHTDDGWTVLARDERVLYKGEFEACVEWVQQNHFQYRRLLYGT